MRNKALPIILLLLLLWMGGSVSFTGNGVALLLILAALGLAAVLVWRYMSARQSALKRRG